MTDRNLDDSNDQDQNIKVYDNDEAYMFNEENSHHSNSNSIENNDGELRENDLHSNPNENEENDNNQEEDNQLIEEQDLQNPMKDQDEIEEEEGDTIRNKQNNNEEESQNNQEMNEEDNEENAEIPLITLKYISICQCCKNSFNATVNIPYLFKCGHFFCKKCIDQHFTDEEGIKCPNDGLIAKKMSDLKLLNNLISDKAIELQSSRGNYCEIHKGQKLTHFIEDTREMICVYCAFTRFKKNPKYEIKEIKEKCGEIANDVDGIIDENQHNIEILHSALKDIKKNKELEEKRVNNLFDQVLSYIQNKKTEILNQIETIFTDNANKLNQKFEIYSSKISNSENLKEMINDLIKNDSGNFGEILDQYNKFIRDNNERVKNTIQIQDYRFSHDEETKLYKYINNFGDLKIVSRGLAFGNNNTNLNRDDEEFGLKGYKMPTQGNVNPNHNEIMMNNSELQNTTYDFRIQNGRESKKLFPSSTQTKNIMSKYSYTKPMTPGEYRTEFRNYQYQNK